MKPTDDEITEYILQAIRNLDGYGLVITDEELVERELKISAKSFHYAYLREDIFNQE